MNEDVHFLSGEVHNMYLFITYISYLWFQQGFIICMTRRLCLGHLIVLRGKGKLTTSLDYDVTCFLLSNDHL